MPSYTMPNFSSWADLPPSPADSLITSDMIRSILGPDAEPPLMARLLGFNSDRKVEAIRHSVQRSQQALVDRQLTDSEIAALAQYSSSEGDKGAQNQMIVLASALAITIYGRKKMTFPLWKPKGMAMFDTFPSPRVPWLSGQNAKRAWHFSRFSAYYVGSTVTIGIFLNSISTRAALTEKAIDPRLRDYLRDTILDPQNQSIILQLQNERNIPLIEFRRQDDPAVLRAREIRRKRFYEALERNMTPEQKEKIEERRRKLEHTESEWRERTQESQQQRFSPVSAPGSVWTQRRNGISEPAPTVQRQIDDDDPFADKDEEDEDDMSPVPAHIRRQEAQEQRMKQAARLRQQQEIESSGGSAWDRLRANAMSGENQTSQWSASSASNASRSPDWGSASGENIESQSDFDALLETERRSQSSSSKWN